MPFLECRQVYRPSVTDTEQLDSIWNCVCLLEVHRIQDADYIFPHRQRFELFGRLNMNILQKSYKNEYILRHLAADVMPHRYQFGCRYLFDVLHDRVLFL